MSDLREALEALIADIEDYERINNLAPSPGKSDCWQSVTRAKAALAQPQGDGGAGRSIPTCCVTGAIPGDGGACGDCDPCIFGEPLVPDAIKRLISEKNSLLNRIGELEDAAESPPSSRMRRAFKNDATFSIALDRVKAGASMHRRAWKSNKFIRVRKPIDGSLTYLELAYVDGRCAPWTPTRCDLMESDWREFEALRAGDNHASDGKESEGGERSRAFGAILKNEANRLRKRADELDPPAATAQREAIARIVRSACCATFLNGYSDENIQRATDDLLALQTRAGG